MICETRKRWHSNARLSMPRFTVVYFGGSSVGGNSLKYDLSRAPRRLPYQSGAQFIAPAASNFFVSSGSAMSK